MNSNSSNSSWKYSNSFEKHFYKLLLCAYFAQVPDHNSSSNHQFKSTVSCRSCPTPIIAVCVIPLRISDILICLLNKCTNANAMSYTFLMGVAGEQ